MITKERGEEESDDEVDKVQDGCDEVDGGELCPTEVVLVVRGRRIRVDRYNFVSCQSNLEKIPPPCIDSKKLIHPQQGPASASVQILQSSVQSSV